MKALYIPKVGDASVVEYGDLPEPTIADPRDVLVRVRAADMNRLDVFHREGSHGSTPPRFPYIAGRGFAGEVAAVGQKVTRFKVGDKVFGQTVHTHAQFTLVRPDAGVFQNALEIIPPGLSYEEAASIPVTHSMAYHMLHCRGGLKAGETVLLMGASSGTGSAGIQLAKAAGARVITTASTEEKLKKAKALGADEVINYREVPKFSERVLALTDGQGVDMVFEHIGAPVWEECFATLKRGGRFVICGVTAGHKVSLHLGRLWSREMSVIGASNRPEEDLVILAQMLAKGVIRPVVDSVLPLEAGAEAQHRMETGNFFGKIVLSVP